MAPGTGAMKGGRTAMQINEAFTTAMEVMASIDIFPAFFAFLFFGGQRLRGAIKPLVLVHSSQRKNFVRTFLGVL
jgi:hypothetical protein